MYAYRKPFTVASFPGELDIPGLHHLGYKSLFIIAQGVGYAASKFLGIHHVLFCSLNLESLVFSRFYP